MAQVPLATPMVVVYQLVLYSGAISSTEFIMKTHSFLDLGLNRHNYAQNL